jgi:hypothetical protein
VTAATIRVGTVFDAKSTSNTGFDGLVPADRAARAVLQPAARSEIRRRSADKSSAWQDAEV